MAWLFACLLIVAWGNPASASAADGGVMTGSISGQVTDAVTGLPLEGVCVGAGGFNLDPSRAPKTDANGRYRLEGVEPGDHLVLVEDCARDRGYLREYYPDFHGGNGSGKRVTVEPGGETGGIDVALDLAAEISGTVRDAKTGEPIAEACISLEQPDPDFGGSIGGALSADGAGRFTTQPLQAGTYYLSFWDCQAREHKPVYWRDQLACPEAAPITLDFGQRFRADAHLPPAANGRRPDPITLCKAPLEFINVARLDLPKVQKQRGKRVVIKGELVIGSRASGRARGHLKLGNGKVRIKSSRLKLKPARGGKPVKLKLRPKRSRDNRKVRRVLQRRNSGKIRGKIRVVLRDRHDRKVSESRKIVLRR